MEALVDAIQAASPKLRFEDVAPRLCGGNRNIQTPFPMLTRFLLVVSVVPLSNSR